MRQYDRVEEVLNGVSDFGKVVVDALEYADVKVFVTALVRSLQKGKRFLFRTASAFTKVRGGITSSDIGVKGLQVRCAEVLGQIRPGVPVWKTGENSRFPGIPYVVFPGNVGAVYDLRIAVETLCGMK